MIHIRVPDMGRAWERGYLKVGTRKWENGEMGRSKLLLLQSSNVMRKVNAHPTIIEIIFA